MEDFVSWKDNVCGLACSCPYFGNCTKKCFLLAQPGLLLYQTAEPLIESTLRWHVWQRSIFAEKKMDALWTPKKIAWPLKRTLLCLGLNTSSSHKESRTQSVREGIDLEASPYRRSHSILSSSIGKWLCIKNWTPSSSWGPAIGSSVVLPWHDKQSTHEMLIPALVKWRGFTSAVLICLCKKNVVVIVVSKTLLPACTVFFAVEVHTQWNSRWTSTN